MTIPFQLSGFNNLEYLNLSNNHLTMLPSQLAELKQLTYIDMEFNQLQEIPSFLPKECVVFDIGNPATSQNNQELKPRTF
jgi:Leucine-rich repeat (LRR) protein